MARKELERIYGPRLSRLVLFGSQARGDARKNSDVDILVVLKGELDLVAETERLVDIEIDFSDRYRVYLHLIPASEERYTDEVHPLMMNVHSEGVDV